MVRGRRRRHLVAGRRAVPHATAILAVFRHRGPAGRGRKLGRERCPVRAAATGGRVPAADAHLPGGARADPDRGVRRAAGDLPDAPGLVPRRQPDRAIRAAGRRGRQCRPVLARAGDPGRKGELPRAGPAQPGQWQCGKAYARLYYPGLARSGSFGDGAAAGGGAAGLRGGGDREQPIRAKARRPAGGCGGGGCAGAAHGGPHPAAIRPGAFGRATRARGHRRPAEPAASAAGP